MKSKANALFIICTTMLTGMSLPATADTFSQRAKAVLVDCKKMINEGFRPIVDERNKRFEGKVKEHTASCRGGKKAVKFRDTPWTDWQNYWATGDESTKAAGIKPITLLGKHLKANGRGIDGALIDLEFQRVELIKFNLFDNQTYEDYVKGRDGVAGRALKTWDAFRLPKNHPRYKDVGGNGKQLCTGKLIRHRTLTGICNDIKNPLMGSTNQPFPRNVNFEETFPRLRKTELVNNRHGDRLGLLKPDPQVISRKLFTRQQSNPEKCKQGFGLANDSKEADCDYKKAPFFNVLAAFWIQFMTHDWFSHLREGHNTNKMMTLGCKSQKVNNIEQSLSRADINKLGCRPDDKMETSYYAETSKPQKFSHKGKEHLARAHKTTANTVTAWWDASQLYGYDKRSGQRVKRDPKDRAKLLLEKQGNRPGKGEKYGYLPKFESCRNKKANKSCIADPINPAWAGQEAVAFPDNWNIGLSFYHNVFAREHNLFVDEFRRRTKVTPKADSGLRDPKKPKQVIRNQDVTDDELFQAARLVIAAEIAKIHTIEWTTQLLYDEPLHLGMNSNWYGLFKDFKSVAEALERVTVNELAKTENPEKATHWFSVFASGPGIFGLGNHIYEDTGLGKKKDVWSLENPQHINGGINHFGSPFNFPEEFATVYRLHPLVPDLVEFRELHNDPNKIRNKVPVVNTFRHKATDEMDKRGLADWGLSMGRQRLGLLSLQNSPLFLQNLELKRLNTPTGKIDVVALDIVRGRERGVPRFNEFRRQYGLKHLTSFDDFIDKHLGGNSEERSEQVKLVKLLREVYGQHKCDASKIISSAQLNEDGTPINDCLGHKDASMIDNIEDVDTVVGWLAETTRPHGFAISEIQFQVFILNASRRLFSDRFFTSSFRPEFYTHLGVDWVNDNGPTGKVMEQGKPNGHEQEVLPLKRVLMRTMPELKEELKLVVNTFDPWARDRGEYYTLDWKPRKGAEGDEAFK